MKPSSPHGPWTNGAQQNRDRPQSAVAQPLVLPPEVLPVVVPPVLPPEDDDEAPVVPLVDAPEVEDPVLACPVDPLEPPPVAPLVDDAPLLPEPPSSSG